VPLPEDDALVSALFDAWAVPPGPDAAFAAPPASAEAGPAFASAAWTRLAATSSLLQSTEAGVATRPMAKVFAAVSRINRDRFIYLPPRVLRSIPPARVGTSHRWANRSRPAPAVLLIRGPIADIPDGRKRSRH